VTFDNLTSSKAGNVDVRAVGADDPTTVVDLLLTASLNGANATINTDSDSIGAANQSMDQGETVRIDFVTNVQTNAGLPSGFSYDDHVGTNSYIQTIPQVQGSQNQTVAFRVYALDTSVTDAGSPDDTPVAGPTPFSDSSTVAITEVTVDGFDVGETPVTVAIGAVGVWTAIAYGVYAQLQADGSVIFTGIQEGDQYGIGTGSNDFNAIAVTSLAAGVGPAGHTSSTNSFDLGVFAIGQVDTGDPINLHFDVTGTDADGDTSTGGIDVVLAPDTSGQEPLVVKTAPTQTANDSSSATLLADSHDTQKVAANSNTLATAAAVAAAGIADSQAAAASTAGHHADLDRGEALVQAHTLRAAADGADHGSDAGPSAIAAETAQVAHDNAKAASNHSTDVQEHRSFDKGHAEAPAANDHAAANDKGPAVADAHVAAAPVVAMASAEALQAAGLTGDGKHVSVEKIVAEALGHGNGHGAVDALLDAFHGGNGGGQAIANLASGGANAVSAWDMASEGASSVAHEMLMKVGASITHHDMVPPTHNG
jgi:hypothetical protein